MLAESEKSGISHLASRLPAVVSLWAAHTTIMALKSSKSGCALAVLLRSCAAR